MRIFVVFLIIIVVVILKITANPAYYLTPDSHYYLQAAQNLLDGRGYRIDFQGQDTFCAIWPAGYSLLIAGLSFFTKLSVTLSSKVVNLLAVAGILWLIHRQYKAQSWFVALALLSSSFLQLYANTWSETIFIFCLVGVVSHGSIVNGHESWVVGQEKKNTIPLRRTVHTSYITHLIFAFLTRYIGFFLIIPLLIQRKYKTVLVFSAFIGLYLLNNYAQTQTFTGNHGHFSSEPFTERLTRGLKGISEEIAFWGIRDWDLKSGSEALKAFIYGISAVQLGILLVIGWLIVVYNSKKATNSFILSVGSANSTLRIKEGANQKKPQNVVALHIVPISYFATTIVLYLIDDSMESLYFRRLAPATFLALIGGLGWLAAPAQKRIFKRVKWWVVAFFMLSVVHALPKVGIFGLLK